MFHRIVRIDACLDQQSRRDHPCPSEAAATVNEDVLAHIEPRSQVAAHLRPFPFELGGRRADVRDRHMHPLYPAAPDSRADPRDRELTQLSRFEQRHDDCRVPGGDRVEILVEVSRPGAAERFSIVLIWREGHANLSPIRSDVDFGNADRIGFARLDHCLLKSSNRCQADVVAVAQLSSSSRFSHDCLGAR